jgi:murein DD-endopeptidase MepM/ murein hydrolase activator NlpD
MKPLLFTLFIFMFFQAHAVEVLPNGRFPKNLSESARFGVARSKSSTYHSVFDRHESIDKNRHIGDFTLYRDGEVLYTLTDITASDMRVSNAGYTLVFEKGGESTLRFYSPAGKMVREVSGENYILGEFSERGNLFALATPEQTSIISLKSRTVTTFPPAQNIAFSPDESHFAIGCSSGVKIFTTAGDLRTAISHDEFYIRRLAFSPDARYLSFIGKKKLYTYDRESEKTAFTDSLSDNRNFNDILFENGSLVAGTYARNRQENHVEGSTVSYSMDGHKTAGTATALREYAPALTHNEHGYGEINEQGYESVPWPHYPFDEPDTVWNGYLALSSSGDGNNSAAYLHQGTDLNVANHEAAHSVSDGYVKAYLSTGGELYWRVAVAPENTSARQNGWLYAHLVERSVAVNVGDYVQQGDYIGDVIPWPNLVGGHLHFSRLEHSGQVWDGNWRNKENPVFSLRPHGDNIPPEIRTVYNDSKFGFTTNTSNPQRLSADNLQGDIDILARVSDKAGISEWRQPASTINYWFTDARTGDTVVPKELALWRGQDMPDYNGSLYRSLVPVMYRVTREFPVNGWFTHDRLFIHVITNNDADSSLTPDHSQYGFNTAEYPDGEYNLVVEVFDEAGNSTVDSQTVIFNNGNAQTYTLSVESSGGGSVSLSPDGSVFEEGTEVELTAQAEEGYTFSGWSGDISGSDNPATLTMNSNKNVSAQFEIDDIDIEGDNLSGYLGWYTYIDEHGSSIDTSGGLISNDSVVTISFDMVAEDAENDIWPYGAIASEIATPLVEPEYMFIEYRADQDFDLILPMSTITQEGAYYRASLPETDGSWNKRIIKLSKPPFAQPEWADAIPFDKTIVESFEIAPAYTGAEGELGIRVFIIDGYSVDQVGIEDGGNALSSGSIRITSNTAESLGIFVPEKGIYDITAFTINGRQIGHVKNNLQAGNNTVRLLENDVISSNLILLHIAGEGFSRILRVNMQ